MRDADVLVVGCGPVGVMAALRCAQWGLKVIAIDRSTEIYPLPRALGMDDETQRIFDRAGLLKELQDNSVPLRGGEFVDVSGERVVGVEFPAGAVGALGLPPVITFDQPGVERFLRDAAVAAGVDMRLGVEAVAVGDLDDGVSLDVDAGKETRSLGARWLIAADGAKSSIRDLRRTLMIDQGFDQTWLVVDTTVLDDDLALPHLARQICDPARICTFVPGPGAHRRWEFQLRPDEQKEDVLDDAAVARFLSPWGTPDQLRIDRTAVYRFHANVAERFRDGPVFLAGDAAHQMPPFNGQGMCSGIRDAENLAWKLAMVSTGGGDDQLLDTYDAERRPHATKHVAYSVDSGQLMLAIANDGRAGLERGYGQRSAPRQTGDLFHGDHDRVGRLLPASATRSGACAVSPDFGMGMHWIVIATSPVELPEPWVQIGAKAVVAPSDAYPNMLTDDVAIVVRPDGYVAAVTEDLMGTLERFSSFFGQSVL